MAKGNGTALSSISGCWSTCLKFKSRPAANHDLMVSALAVDHKCNNGPGQLNLALICRHLSQDLQTNSLLSGIAWLLGDLTSLPNSGHRVTLPQPAIPREPSGSLNPLPQPGPAA